MDRRAEITPRWEWRAFDDSIQTFRNLFANFKPSFQKQSEEMYFLVPQVELNLKIRQSIFDVKRRLAVHPSGMEQWVPIMKHEFPLGKESFDEITELLRLSDIPFLKPLEESDLTAILVSNSHITSPSIKKIRNIYSIQELQAEFTQIHLSSRKIFTIALESEEPERISEVKHLLGIATLENENYPELLKRKTSYKGA